MRKTFTMLLFAISVVNIIAQEVDSLTLTISADQYRQLEKHFTRKAKEKLWTTDWARFNRYEDINDTIQKPVKVVFLGNSITDGWYKKRTEFFKKNDFIGRGISGQTTSQMLVRFQADIIDLHPRMVVILAGTNDIAQNNGFISYKHILQNIKSMCELAKLHKIKPVLCSIPPVYQFQWHKDLKPAENIKMMNELIKKYAAENNIPYVDYYSELVDERGGMRATLSEDGAHPNADCYEIMEKIVLKTIRKYVKKR